MDIAPNGQDFLVEFVKSLGEERGEEKTESESTSDNIVSSSIEVGNNSDPWIDIGEALERWTDQILDAETRRSKTAGFRENIEASLRRQQLDGFLSAHDISELRYVADIWTNLLNCTSSYSIGCEFVKRDIITYLLELYKLRQINESLFIETCLLL